MCLEKVLHDHRHICVCVTFRVPRMCVKKERKKVSTANDPQEVWGNEICASAVTNSQWTRRYYASCEMKKLSTFLLIFLVTLFASHWHTFSIRPCLVFSRLYTAWSSSFVIEKKNMSKNNRSLISSYFFLKFSSKEL